MKPQKPRPLPLSPPEPQSRNTVADRDSAGEKLPPPRYYLNVRLLVTACVILLVIGTAIPLVHFYQQQQTSRSLRVRAETNLADGNPGVAARQLASYLAMAPDDLEARIQLDELNWTLAEKPGQIQRAIKFTEQLLRENDGLEARRWRHVDDLIRYGRPTDAISHIEILRNSAASDFDPAALDLVEGICHDAAGRREDAALAFGRIAMSETEFPNVTLAGHTIERSEVIVRLVQITATELNRREQALALLDKAIERFPGSAGLRVFRAKFHLATGTANESTANDLEAALEQAGDADAVSRVETLLLFGQHLRRSQTSSPDRITRAIEQLRQIADEGTDDYRVYQESAALQKLRGEDEAIDTLRNGIDALPEEPMLVVLLADELLNRGDQSGVRELIESEDSTELPPELNAYIQGRIAYEEEDYETARRNLEHFRASGDMSSGLAGRVWLHLANCHGKLGAPRDQLQAARNAKPYPEVASTAQLSEARALARLGQLDESLRAYHRLPPHIAAPSEIARVELTRVLQQPLGRREWQRFDETIEQAIRETPDAPDVVILRARALVERGRHDEADALLEEACASSPQHLPLWVSRIELQTALGNRDAATGTLGQARMAHGNHVMLVAAEIPLLPADRSADATALVTSIEDRLEEVPREQLGIVVRQLIDVSQQAGRADDMLRWYRMLACEVEPSRGTLLNLLRLAVDHQAAPIASEATSRIRTLEGENSPYAAFAETLTELCTSPDTTATVRQARDAVGKLARQTPHEPAFWIEFGRLNEQTGRTDEAINAYLEAVDRGAANPALLRRLMPLLAKQQRYGEIGLLKDQLARAAGHSPLMGQLLIEATVLSGDGDAAANQLERFGEGGDPLWRGRILMATGRNAEAEKEFRQAVDEQPDREEAWLTLVDFLLVDGQPNQARNVAGDARLSTPEARAQLAQLFGDLETARSIYHEAYRNAPTPQRGLALAELHVRSGRREECIDLLQEMLRSERDIPGKQRLVARRLLAREIARRDLSDFDSALDLIGVNLQEADDKRTERKELARLYGIHPFPEHAAKVEEILNGLSRYGTLDATDLLLLAQALDTLGKSQEADQTWQNLLVRSDLTVAMRKEYIRRSLQQEDATAARPHVTRLRSQVGLDRDVLLYSAWTSCLEEGRLDAVTTLIDDYLNPTGDEADVQRKSVAAGVIAQLVEEFAGNETICGPLTTLANRLYVQVTPVRPAQALSHSLLLTSVNRGRDAIGVLESVRGQVDEIQRLAAAIRVVELTDVPDDILHKTGQWVDELIATRPTAQALMLYEHYLRVTGKFERARELNQQLLEVMPDNVVVLNNQAWLLTILNHPADALPLIERAIDIAGPLPFLLDTSAMARAATGEAAQAIRDLERALAQEESDVIRYHLAVIHLSSGNRDAAAFHFEKITTDLARLRRSLPTNERADFDRVAETL
ncbi:tetratricopeptide repeat protein [Maioricimonas sp. JC845]|uniref:tetratricopeptide repeat protein n=1 Tax=Maioricimonas sp. JC845 TaxID=3232138 RepID=UPI0034592C90